jgi:cell division septation protein DedD
MRGVFEDEEVELSRQRHETELTLTSATLLGIFFGMVLLCVLFFGLGFAVGRYGRGEPKPANQQTSAAAPSASTAGSSRPKPSASAQNTAEPQRTVVSLPSDEASNANPAASSQHSESTPAPASFPSHPLVKPALPSQPNSSQSAPPLRVEPSVSPALSLMVQIAAVSHQEDAQVLVSALRKRGYAVSVRRLPSDSLLHVQVGPFANHNEAYSMRQKLLSDGYNAIVQP